MIQPSVDNPQILAAYASVPLATGFGADTGPTRPTPQPRDNRGGVCYIAKQGK